MLFSYFPRTEKIEKELINCHGFGNRESVYRKEWGLLSTRATTINVVLQTVSKIFSCRYYFGLVYNNKYVHMYVRTEPLLTSACLCISRVIMGNQSLGK